MKSLSFYKILGFSPSFHKILKALKQTTTKPYNFSIWRVVNNIAFALAALNSRLLFEDQVNMFKSSLVRKFPQYRISFAFQCRYIIESSAYWRQVQLLTQFFISMTHKLNNTGPKIYHCGTPNFEYKKFEWRESICRKWFLLDK